MNRPKACTALLALSLLLVAADARAETDAKRAQRLYDEALTSMESGDYASACPKLEESQRLDAGLGAQFNLAECYAHTGRLGSAYLLFAELIIRAHEAGKEKLEASSRARVKELGPVVGRLRIVLAPGDADATIKVDGAAIRLDDRGLQGVPLDARSHVVDVTAASRQPWTGTFVVSDGKLADAKVPPLTRAVVRITTQEVRTRTTAIAAIALASAGVVGLGLGGYFGFRALSLRNEARDTCGAPDPKQCRDAAGLPVWDDAQTAGTISTIGLIAGGTLLAAGGVVWFFGPTESRAPLSASATPSGVSVRGAF